MNLREQLKLYLQHFDLTAAQLSRKAGVSQQVLSLWLKGGEPKKMSQVKKVAESLGVSMDHLCYGYGIKESEGAVDIDHFIGDSWISGLFEVKLRRVKRKIED